MQAAILAACIALCSSAGASPLMRPPSCDHVRASFAPCHSLRHQAVHAQSHFVTLVPWIGRNALRGRGDTRPRVLRRLVLRMAAPWEKEGGDGVPWARGGAEGNVERGLREDRDALLMGKRQDGRVACGSGFGGADAVTLWNLLPPNVTDCYSCVSELGRGTFGTVILAENRNASATPRRVAVKLCRPNDSEVGMMLKEGMALQRLNSPMIARLVHMGCVSANGGLVYTMLELLQGKSVHEMLTERGPLGIAEACRVGINVLDGLRDVHRAGFIHRDIKPQNIICVELEDGSRVYKLIDFGTATGALGVGRVGLPAFVPVDGEDSGGGREGAGKGKAVGMRQVFDSIDYQQNGQLSYEDVFRSLASLGLRTDAATIQDLVQKYDADGNGVIEFQEFGQMYGELVGLPYAAYGRSSSNLPILEEAFKSLTGDTGRMSLAMLEQCFASLQRQMPPERVRALFDKYDTNGDGTLMLEEFIPMFGELVAMQDAMNWQGTHGYMSPEQYLDEPVSPASDIWAVGASLFKLTTGQTPFTVTGGTWGKGIVGDKTVEAPPLTNLLFNAPPSFAAIVGKALKKDASQRYSSAVEMREALAEVLDELGPMLATPYIVKWDTPGAFLADSDSLYTHGVAWEKTPRER